MKRYTLTRWSRLTVLHFDSCVMRPLVGIEETSKLSCYHIRLPPGSRMEPAYHRKAHELIWIMEGRGTALLDGRRVPVRDGDVLFIPPPTVHGFVAGRRPLVMLAMLSPRVDSRTDFYSAGPGRKHEKPKVLSGRWTEGTRRARR